MARIPDAFIDELLARVDIVELIEQRIPLKRQGREYSARCPFHDERSPSFTVSPAKQFYHCFGCGAHGTALKFLMEFDRLEFLDAVDELAARVGMTVPREAPRHAANTGDGDDLYGVLDAAAKLYQRELARDANARAYVAGRGLDAKSIERFAIGYAPDAWDTVRNALGGDERKLRALDKVGLLSKNEQGRVYDKFRDRIMFPIRDRRGRVIAFGGRVLKKDDGPKYLNSPETALFHKGRELFALYEARQSNSKLARLIVVEGYLDVIALFQYGITQAVATLGTSTSRDHAELLFRNSPDVYFCFDGDRAGRAAAWRAVESVLPVMKDGRQAHFLFLPEGEDPDSIVRQEGAEGFEARLRGASTLSEFFFAHNEEGIDMTVPDARTKVQARSQGLIESMPDGTLRDMMRDRLAEKTTIQWHEVTTLAADASPEMRGLVKAAHDDRRMIIRGQRPDWVAKTVPQGIPKSMAATQGGPRRSLVRSAIALLLQQPSLVQAMEPPYLFSALRQPGIALLMELIAICRERPEIGTGALLEHFSGRDEYAALGKLVQMDFPAAPEHWKAEFLDALTQLNRQTVQQRVDELLERQQQGGLADGEKAELRELLAAKARR